MPKSSTVKKTSRKPVSLVWLRRDLRLYDHRAFESAAKAGRPVQPIFLFDTEILARFRLKNDRRLTLIAETLCAMHAELSRKNAGLLIFYGKPLQIVPALCRALACGRLFAAEDFEPATRRRDEEVEKALPEETAFTRVPDHLLMAPREIMKKDGSPFKVFTPYARAWRKQAAAQKNFAREAELRGLELADYKSIAAQVEKSGLKTLNPDKGPESLLQAMKYERQAHDWPVMQARARLKHFIQNSISDYTQARNIMGQDGTSRLSPYLRFGLLSVRECARLAFEAEHESSGATTWISELIWRDFYAMILFHFPDTERQEMREQYRGLSWAQNHATFERFIEGKTGFPIIDAAMRQLLVTGYMHNRARMITASFMTKDLLLDWRLGEEHFAQYLMDYELSANVGGWQWAASTGTDSQPYFRIFNPALQSVKFDPEARYIRRYVPELAHLSDSEIHEPKGKRPAGYPEPIVDHKTARDYAIKTFRDKRAS